MLDEITVLNEYPIMYYVFNWQVGFIVGAILFIVLFVCFKIFERADWLPSIVASVIVGTMCFFAFGGIFAREVPTSAKEYQVTIEDYVSINDVYDYYEVVDKEGDIWTIRKLIDET